jgi:hypothetical protein
LQRFAYETRQAEFHRKNYLRKFRHDPVQRHPQQMPRSGKDLMSGLRELTQDSDLTAGSLTATGTIAAGAIERAVLGFLEKYNPI